ncbi:MAG: phosphatase PAP2 family protein [Ignavibacteria bacterium]|nr:MAG: phosphatase PAP2 family protein [Ignavibacteria bacterium]
MVEFLYSVDKAVFYFCNQTIANPVFDAAMPILTDWSQHWYGQVLFGLLWLLLVWKGGKKGRTTAFLLIPLILMTDQLNNNVFKSAFARPRPCHIIEGRMVVEHVRLLVSCGGGYSFPSGHAVNNFAAASFFSQYYRRWAWAFYTYAGLMAFSRMSVGVHYPSDVLAGAAVGALFGSAFVHLWRLMGQKFPALSISDAPPVPNRARE